MADAGEMFSLRTATIEDIPALHRLIEASVRGLQAGDYTQRQIEGALGNVLGMDTRLVEDGTYFVASPCGEPGVFAACGGWSRRRTLFGADQAKERDSGWLDPLTEAAKIRAFFVHPEFARRGLGTLLLARCESEALATGFRVVEMGSTLTGVALYSRRGYVAGERRLVALPNGESLPIVHMRKVL